MQRRHVRGHGGDRADPLDDGLDGVRQVRQEDGLDEPGQDGQPIGFGRLFRRFRRGRRGDGRAVAAGRDEIDDEFRPPGELPQLVERAGLAVRPLRRTPRTPEDPEAVQEVAAPEIDLAAEVEVDRLLRLVRFEAEALLLAGEVGGERRDGRVARDLAHRPADDQAVPDDRERHVGAERGHGTNGLRQLLERWHGAAAHRGEGVGEARRLDEVGRRDVEVLGAEDAGDARHPASPTAARGPSRGARTSRATRSRRRSRTRRRGGCRSTAPRPTPS